MVESTNSLKMTREGTSSFLKLSPILRSKLAFTEIFAFAFTHDSALSILKGLCKSGKEFIKNNPDQLRSFCMNKSIRKCALSLGKQSF